MKTSNSSAQTSCINILGVNKMYNANGLHLLLQRLRWRQPVDLCIDGNEMGVRVLAELHKLMWSDARLEVGVLVKLSDKPVTLSSVVVEVLGVFGGDFEVSSEFLSDCLDVDHIPWYLVHI